MNRSEVIDRYFMEHRAKLIDIAAFLDRLDRSRADDPDNPAGDYRIDAFLDALRLLTDGEPHRARRVLDSFSDPTTDPIESAAGLKGAFGAYADDDATGADA